MIVIWVKNLGRGLFDNIFSPVTSSGPSSSLGEHFVNGEILPFAASILTKIEAPGGISMHLIWSGLRGVTRICTLCRSSNHV